MKKVYTRFFSILIILSVFFLSACENSLIDQVELVRATAVASAQEMSSATFKSFRIVEPAADGIISENNITVFVPWDTTNLAMRIAEFDCAGTVTVNGTVQISGVTPNDFVSPLTYRVTSPDGEVYQDFTVMVINNPPPPTVVPHERTMDISWSAVDDAVGYEVWYYAGNVPAAAVKSGGTITGTSLSVSNLINGVTYYAWIKAVYAGSITSGLGGVSNAALVEKKYFAWLYSGDATEISRYPLSQSDGSVGSGVTVYDPADGGSVLSMEIDEINKFLFFAYERTDNIYMVNSASIDPHTGSLTVNTAMTTDSHDFHSLVLSPDRKHLYGNTGDNFSGCHLYSWDIDPITGELSNKRSTSLGSEADTWTYGMAVNPDNNLLYMVHYSYAPYGPSILIYDINSVSGDLSYRTSFQTEDYPLDVAYSINNQRLIVSYQTAGVSSWQLDEFGIPMNEPARTNDLSDGGSGSWKTVVSFPVKGSTTKDHIFALDNDIVNPAYLRGLSDDDTFSYTPQLYSAGIGAWDMGLVTFLSGDTFLYTANRNSGSISAFKLGDTAGTLTVSTGQTGINTPWAIRGLNTYW